MLHTGPCLLFVPTHGLVCASSLLLLSHIHHIGLGPSCNLVLFFFFLNILTIAYHSLLVLTFLSLTRISPKYPNWLQILDFFYSSLPSARNIDKHHCVYL